MTHEMFKSLIEPIFAAIGMAIATAIGAVLLRVFKRLGIQTTAEEQAAVATASQRIVLAVAEKGAQGAATGVAKLEAATTALVAKFPKLTPAEVDTQIHAAVAVTGVGALASSGAAVPPPLPPAPEVKQ